MYSNMMEMADTITLCQTITSYTQALFSAIPKNRKERIEDKQILGGDAKSSQPTKSGYVCIGRCSP